MCYATWTRRTRPERVDAPNDTTTRLRHKGEPRKGLLYVGQNVNLRHPAPRGKGWKPFGNL